jgi:hypothetical protein
MRLKCYMVLLRTDEPMKNSPSFHMMNVDLKKKEYWRILYRLCNTLNNRWFPNAIEPHLRICDFVCEIAETDWQHLDLRRSPSRILSELFWLKLPWRAIGAELGQTNIFDTGCGDGKYGGETPGVQPAWHGALYRHRSPPAR